MRKSLATRTLRPVLRAAGRLTQHRVLGQMPRLRPTQSFSTIEVCHLFDISKATLYRWEREGLISMPSRDWRKLAAVYVRQCFRDQKPDSSAVRAVGGRKIMFF